MSGFFFNEYPYTDFHELNLSWLIKKMIELNETVKNFVSLNTIKYADPIQWNIASQYEKNTVVVDPQTGTAYLSVAPVPSGVALSNPDYWTVIFDLDIAQANNNITLRDDGNNVLSTFTSDEGDWLLWNGTLYRVTQPIALNEAYVIGYNIERYTVEEFIRSYITALNNIIGDLDDLNTTDKTSIVNAINEVLTIVGDLDDLNTTDKTSIVNAINELTVKYYANVKDYGAKGDGSTDDRQAFIDAIASGKIVIVPEGYYRISAPITIGGNIAIVGVGCQKTFINFDTQATDNHYVFDGTGATTKRGALFKDFTLNVNNYTMSLHYIGGIFLENYIGVEIQNVEVLNTCDSGNGIVLKTCSEGVIDSCYMHELYGDGIYVCDNSYNITVSNNKILNCQVPSGCIDLYNCYHIICTGNHVQPNNTSTFGFNLDTVQFCEINDNVCFNGARGIACFVVQHCNISNNIVRQTSLMGIQIEISIDGVTTSNYNLVEGNTIYDCQFGIVDNCHGTFNKFIGNSIDYSKRHGIYVIGGNYADISGNTITNSGQETANTYSDIVCAPHNNVSNYNKISDNVCSSGQALRNIECQANVDYLTITDNQLISFGGDFNIVVATQTNMIASDNRGTANF